MRRRWRGPGWLAAAICLLAPGCAEVDPLCQEDPYPSVEDLSEAWPFEHPITRHQVCAGQPDLFDLTLLEDEMQPVWMIYVDPDAPLIIELVDEDGRRTTAAERSNYTDQRDYCYRPVGPFPEPDQTVEPGAPRYLSIEAEWGEIPYYLEARWQEC